MHHQSVLKDTGCNNISDLPAGKQDRQGCKCCLFAVAFKINGDYNCLIKVIYPNIMPKQIPLESFFYNLSNGVGVIF